MNSTEAIGEQVEEQDELRPVTIHVNEQPVVMPKHRATGLEIKQEAIAQGVNIQLDFILVQEAGPAGTEDTVIGDDDHIHISKLSRFVATDGDDNS